MRQRPLVLAAIAIIVFGGALWWWQTRPTATNDTGTVNQPVTSNTNTGLTNTNTPTPDKPVDQVDFSTADVTDRDPHYNFEAQIPRGWVVEAVSGSQALNIYDPNAPGDTPLAQSQIFIRYFTANNFQTLTTVTINSQVSKTIHGHAAVEYSITKKDSAADFANQPAWRNETHTVTDIQVTTATPHLYLVIAKAPGVSDSVYQSFLNSLTFPTSATFSWPISDGLARITKKYFGIQVSPQNSPVSPERFSGYHTGIDFETTPEEADSVVPIRAVADGRVVSVSTVNGYGGVVMIQHRRDNQLVMALYGHLQRSSIAVQPGASVAAAEVIGQLGKGYTAETSGERKHLHLALWLGTDQRLKGYVSQASQLSNWIDPQQWLQDVKAVDPLAIS